MTYPQAQDGAPSLTLPSLQTPALSATTCREQPCMQHLLWTLFYSAEVSAPSLTLYEGGEQSAGPAGIIFSSWHS